MEPSAKKRKLEALDENDPKLQEFLDVMNPGQASKRPREQHNEKPTDPLPPPVEEGESDDEYQDIPSSRQQTQAVQIEGGRERIKAMPEPDPEPAEPIIVAREVAKVQASAPDDDWLRSRTSRLLDLVDPDDPSPPVPSSEPPKISKPRDESKRDHVPESEEHEAAPIEKQDPDSALDLIRKTSRVFVRNLSYGVTEEDLTAFLATYGAIEEVRCAEDLVSRNRTLRLVMMNPDRDILCLAYDENLGSVF